MLCLEGVPRWLKGFASGVLQQRVLVNRFWNDMCEICGPADLTFPMATQMFRCQFSTAEWYVKPRQSWTGTLGSIRHSQIFILKSFLGTATTLTEDLLAL